MQSELAWFKRTYLSLDLRSLAAVRIALAIALLISLFNRVIELPYFYTNDGLLPNHAVLWSPVYPYELSFFLFLSHTQEAVVGFAFCFLAFVALLVGFRTRAAQIASFLCAMSLRNRVPQLFNGGDLVLGLLAFWTMFLPLGKRYSIDAARERLSGNSIQPSPGAVVVSLAVAAMLAQLASIYALNFVQKSGETWIDGSALHYTLHQDRIVTGFGVWLREHLSIGQSKLLTKFTLATEAIIPVCILSPFGTRYARRIAALLVLALHAGIGSCLNFGVFVPAMVAFAAFLVPGDDWDRLAPVCERLGVTRLLKRTAAWAGNRHVREPTRFRRPYLREGLVAASMLLASYQLVSENQWFSAVKPPENAALFAAVDYLGLFQGWSMFAPDAPKTDLNVSVDAITVDGRHVDPLNEVASANHRPGLQIPACLGQPWLFSSYIGHVPKYPQFNSMFIDWIGRYHSRTGRESDRIVAFDAYLVEDDSPPLGDRQPRNVRWQRFIRHHFGL